MYVPPVETFEHSLPEREDDTPERGERERSTTKSRSRRDAIHISGGVELIANQKSFLDTVLDRIEIRALQRAPRPEERPVLRPQPRAAAGTRIPAVASRESEPRGLPARETGMHILTAVSEHYLPTYREQHTDATLEDLERLREEISQGFEEGLAEAKRDFAEREALDSDLADAIDETESIVHEGLGFLFDREVKSHA